MILFPISRFTVAGHSMFPTLKPGQDVLVMHWFITVGVGDLIIFKKNGKEMVKRVQKIQSRRSPPAGRQVFVIGDNPHSSTDSRHFGAVSMDQVMGKVIYASSHPDPALPVKDL